MYVLLIITFDIAILLIYLIFKLLAKIEYTIVQYHVVNVLMENVKTGNSIMFFMLQSNNTLINSFVIINLI